MLTKAILLERFLTDGYSFNNLRTSESNLAQEKRAKENRPGADVRGHLRFNTEFTQSRSA